MSDTILHTDTEMDVLGFCSAAPVKKSCYEQQMGMPCLCGADSRTPVGSKESIVRYSATNRSIVAATLSDRLTQSLISAGLVAGITPTSTRKRYGQAILDFAICVQVGGGAE